MTPVLADVVLIAHFAFVLFVAGGLPAIWFGAARGWRWVRNFGFRAGHLAAISFVAVESVVGMACPLTVWEDALRQSSTGPGFIARWLRRLLYYDLPGSVFTGAYLLFALLVALTWWRIPPDRCRSQ